MKRTLFTIGILLLAIIGALVIYKYTYKEENDNTNKFHNEYTLVEKNNVFKYKTIDEIITTLESGTGIIYLGFPECPWCQKYVLYLDEVAKENNIKEMYYYNIKTIRDQNSTKYKKLLELLDIYLPTSDSGSKRIYVPDVVFVKDGTIIANDNETSLISDGSLPEDYWTNENITNFKNKISGYIDSYIGYCTTCN